MKPGIDYIGVTTPFYCNDGKGNFLFHKRSQNCRDEQGAWDMGGGQVEFGETLEESVLREVQEEYGCTGSIQEQLPAHSVLRTHNEKLTHWLAIPFFILVNPKEVINGDPEKLEEIDWFRLANLPQPLHTGFQYTLNRYKQFFKKYR
ncbi:NUDIX domain-containing protein [Candidatus Roizmanbacteria bacterium]|nr:NUDIX domain-containing protein [Candidatus Roizmanbacteria bacterium]